MLAPIRYLRHFNRWYSADRSKYFPALKSIMLPKDTFKGRTALVTGGGTGLGKDLSLTLASLGANVVISSRKQDILDKTAQEIKSQSGNDNILPFAADVRDPEAIENLLNEIDSKFGGPATLIVNNAAGNFISPTERLSTNAFATVVNIVLLGTANVTLQSAKRLIAKEQGGSFLSITTIYAESGSGYVVPSACAKAGVEIICKSLAAEWGKYGLRFNCIQPGPIKTKGAFSRLDPTGSFEKSVIKRMPTGRLGEIQELSNLASYLLSDYANWVNGSIVRFDGGEYASMAGEFNELNAVSQEQWDMLEKMIRQVKGS